MTFTIIRLNVPTTPYMFEVVSGLVGRGAVTTLAAMALMQKDSKVKRADYDTYRTNTLSSDEELSYKQLYIESIEVIISDYVYFTLPAVLNVIDSDGVTKEIKVSEKEYIGVALYVFLNSVSGPCSIDFMPLLTDYMASYGEER